MVGPGSNTPTPQTDQLAPPPLPLGFRECVTLKPKSLTRHNFFSNKFDTTAWNDFTRDPRDAGWLESRRHDGSRNQMYFMRKARGRKRTQGGEAMDGMCSTPPIFWVYIQT